MKSKKSETWYVVFVGASPGIYSRYDEVKRYTQGISKSYFKKYDTKKEALAAFKKSSRADCVSSHHSRLGYYDAKKHFQWGYEPPVRR